MINDPKVPVVSVLCAGMSTRLGRNKLTEDLFGRPLLWYVVENLRRSGLSDIYLVTNEESLLELRKYFTEEKFLVNRNFMEGMGSSIRLAVSSLKYMRRPILVINGDQPFFNSSLIRELVSVYSQDTGRIACASYRGSPRNPAIYPSSFFNDLMSLKGDSGGRSIILRNASHVSFMNVNDEMYLFDVDTDDDLKTAREVFFQYSGAR